jgi:hypothetical protein
VEVGDVVEVLRQLWEFYDEDSSRLDENHRAERLDELVSAVVEAARDDATRFSLRELALQADSLEGRDARFAEFLAGVLLSDPLGDPAT